LTKAKLLKIIQAGKRTKTEAEEIYGTIMAGIVNALKVGDFIPLGGVGTLKMRQRVARTCRNPKTGETFNVPARKTVILTVGAGIKGILNS